MDPMAQLQEHVRSAIGSRGQMAHRWRVDELTRLVVFFWPHHHLGAAAEAGGENSKAIDHALRLLRAQVRERWEAIHGVGPMWSILLSGIVTSIWHVILPLWWSGPEWRERLRQMAGRVD